MDTASRHVTERLHTLLKTCLHLKRDKELVDCSLGHVACLMATACQSTTTGAEEAPAINPGESARGLLDEELGLDRVSATTFS